MGEWVAYSVDGQTNREEVSVVYGHTLDSAVAAVEGVFDTGTVTTDDGSDGSFALLDPEGANYSCCAFWMRRAGN